MGWLFMQSLGAFDTPRAYLDNQFTYQRDTHRLTVLASGMVGSTAGIIGAATGAWESPLRRNPDESTRRS